MLLNLILKLRIQVKKPYLLALLIEMVHVIVPMLLTHLCILKISQSRPRFINSKKSGLGFITLTLDSRVNVIKPYTIVAFTILQPQNRNQCYEHSTIVIIIIRILLSQECNYTTLAYNSMTGVKLRSYSCKLHYRKLQGCKMCKSIDPRSGLVRLG